MFLLPIIAAVILYYLLADRKPSYAPQVKRDIPLEELKKRFVNGEIDEETYLKMKRIIAE